MESLWRDIALAARMLRRTPGLTLSAIVMLAVGIGATTAVFNITYAALLRPFPYVDIDRWATLSETAVRVGSDSVAVSVPNYRDWKRESKSFLDMALYVSWTYNVSGDEGAPERLQAIIITPHIFHRLGLTAAAGRLLREGDEAAPHDPDRPIMISYGLWQRRFGGDPGIAGTKIVLNLVPHKVVGVAPRGFSFPLDSRTDVWAPQSARAIATDQERGARGNAVLGLLRLQSVQLGFVPEYRMTLSYTAPRARYPDIPRLADLAERIREEISHVPGVVAAGAAQTLPFADSASWFQAFTRADPRGLANVATVPHVHYNVVGTGYAEALGLPLKAGRTFRAQDTASAPPVVIINEALANRYFADKNPIGQHVWVGHAPALQSEIRRTIVGIVGDARWSGLDTPAVPEAWVPIAQQPGGDMVLRTMFVMFHTAGEPQASIAAVRARIAHVDKDLALSSMRTLESRLDASIWRQRLAATALAALGLAALTIALLGVFGITSYLVGRRAQEIGVRMAVGAAPRDIIRLVMSENGWLVLIGTALGGGGAFALGRYLSALLYDVTASDAATLGIAALSLASAALLASYVPARRAARADPCVTLRPD